MSTIFLFRKFHYLVLLLFLLMTFQQMSYSQTLDPSTQTKFVNSLPVIKELGLRVDLTKGGEQLTVQMVQTHQDLGLQGISGYLDDGGTTVWGYDFPDLGDDRGDLPATYPGATIVAKKNKKVFIDWVNNLPGHFLPVDASLHMAHPDDLMTPEEVAAWYAAGNVPVVAHLHGGHTESASDGLPEAWFTHNEVDTGDYFVKTNYVYDNTQESATLWYHDHALGITRLNVYAGLAGFYLLRDDNEEKLISKNVLPGGDYEVEIVIQDRMFDTDGELFWPAYPGEGPYDEFIYEEIGDDGLQPWPTIFPNEGPSVLAEFFGDFILVNGMAWPKFVVEPRKYRFRLLNGSDSRFYILEFHNAETGGTAQNFLQIGTDDGLLARPVNLNQLLIAPGERMDIVVDFTDFEGSSIYLRNFGPDEPFKGFNSDGTLSDGEGSSLSPSDPETTGQIMMFDVSKPFNNKIKNASVRENSRLRQNIMPLIQEGPTRQLALFEGHDEYGRLMPMLGTLAGGSLIWDDPITEKPVMNTNEVWEVYNSTADAHPIHLHLVAFQIINREPFDYVLAEKDQTSHSGENIIGGELTSVSLSGNVRDPEENEKGWKDTAVMLPGEVTRVIARFDREGRYVWHCHILSHEDHEMMRPFEVIPKSHPKLSGDAIANVTEFRLDQNYPNPFNPSTIINFSIPKENTLVSLKIYNSIGQEVGTLINQVVPAGNHEVQFDATGLPSGVYFYTLTAGNFVNSKKMIVLK